MSTDQEVILEAEATARRLRAAVAYACSTLPVELVDELIAAGKADVAGDAYAPPRWERIRRLGIRPDGQDPALLRPARLSVVPDTSTATDGMDDLDGVRFGDFFVPNLAADNEPGESCGGHGQLAA